MSGRAISFSMERSSLVGRLRHCALLLASLLRWLFSLVLPTALGHGGYSPPCSSHHSPAGAPARLVKDSLRVLTYGEVARRLLHGDGRGVGRRGGDGDAAETCAVCLGELRRRDRVRVPRNCRHLYHRRCLDRWIDHDEQGTCPLCRAPLLAPPQSDPRAAPVDGDQGRPSWAVEQLLYLFGDDLLPAASPPPTTTPSSSNCCH